MTESALAGGPMGMSGRRRFGARAAQGEWIQVAGTVGAGARALPDARADRREMENGVKGGAVDACEPIL